MATDNKISKVQELIYEIRVGDVMRDDVITVERNSMMSELGKILREKRISGTPVVDRDKLVGIISIDDLIRWLSEREQDCPVVLPSTSFPGAAGGMRGCFGDLGFPPCWRASRSRREPDWPQPGQGPAIVATDDERHRG